MIWWRTWSGIWSFDSPLHLGSSEYIVEHRGGQLAGEGVLLARVVAAQQEHVAVRGLQRGARAMPEARQRRADRAAPGSHHLQRRAPGETAQRDDHVHVRAGQPPL